MIYLAQDSEHSITFEVAHKNKMIQSEDGVLVQEQGDRIVINGNLSLDYSQAYQLYLSLHILNIAQDGMLFPKFTVYKEAI